MLTWEELGGLQLNQAEVEFALDRAEKMLADVLDVRKTTEAKAQQLFTAYTTITLAVFGLATVMTRAGAPKQWGLLACGTCFVAGALMFIRAMGPGEYGYLGSSPSIFLRKGIIDSPEDRTTLSKAYVLESYERRLSKSFKTNEAKIKWLRLGMWAGITGAIVLVPLMLWI